MHKLLITSSLFVAALALGGAGAPGSSPLNPATRTICLDVGGELRPAYCQASSSRLDKREDICLCRSAQKVTAPVCDSGERPAAETRAFEKARKEAARDGSLLGDSFEGRRMCVRARNS